MQNKTYAPKTLQQYAKDIRAIILEEKDVFQAYKIILRKYGNALSQLSKYLEEAGHQSFNIINAFYCKYCTAVRKKLKGSKALKDLLAAINTNQFLENAKMPKYPYIAFTYEAGVAAFDDLLDHYDTNKRTGNWDAFSIFNHETMLPCVWDTYDREHFWKYLESRPVTQNWRVIT